MKGFLIWARFAQNLLRALSRRGGRSTISLLGAFVAIAALALALSACGGGGGSPLPNVSPVVSPTVSATLTPCPAGDTGSPPACMTPAPAPAQAQGKVVDYDSEAPLAGVPVAIASWAPNPTATPSSSPAPVATTAADGTFSFSAPPGWYELRIGSGSATDTRMTSVSLVDLVSGTNNLAVPSPPPQPYVTPDPVQVTGDFRLKTLTSDDTNCLNDANAEYTTKWKQGPFFDDEFTWETARWINLQSVNGIQWFGVNGKLPMNYGGDSAMIKALAGLTIYPGYAENGLVSGAVNSTPQQQEAVWIPGAVDGQEPAPVTFVGIDCNPNIVGAQGYTSGEMTLLDSAL